MDKVAMLTVAFYKIHTTQYSPGPLWHHRLESYSRASYRPDPAVGYQAFKTQGRFVHNAVLCTDRYLWPRRDSADYLVLVEEREQGGLGARDLELTSRDIFLTVVSMHTKQMILIMLHMVKNFLWSCSLSSTASVVSYRTRN